MTTVILPHSHFEPAHLAAVKADMATMGAPRIRVIDGGDHMIAIEGSHRLRAAEATGTPVVFDVIDEDGEIDLGTLDLDDGGWFEGETVVPARDFVEWYTRYPFPADSATVDVDGSIA